MESNTVYSAKNEQFMSDSIADLATALAKAQGEFTIALKQQDNPFYKSSYADFESIVKASRPALSKHGLCVVQSPFTDEHGDLHLITILMHSSGQWVKSKARHIPLKTDIQSLSSYNTYLKRMCYTSLVGVATGDDDDDGEQAVSGVRDNYYKPEPRIVIKSEPQEKISTDQLELLQQELEGHHEIAQRVMKALNIELLADMPKSKFLASINRIREIKTISDKK